MPPWSFSRAASPVFGLSFFSSRIEHPWNLSLCAVIRASRVRVLGVASFLVTSHLCLPWAGGFSAPVCSQPRRGGNQAPGWSLGRGPWGRVLWAVVPGACHAFWGLGAGSRERPRRGVGDARGIPHLKLPLCLSCTESLGSW